MTEITAPKSAVTAEQFADEVREQLKYCLLYTSPSPRD